MKKRPLLSSTDIEALTETLRTIGHEARLKLIDTLQGTGEQSVGDLEALTGIGQPGLSQQLAVLRKSGLVNTRRAAKQVYYSLSVSAFEPVAGFLSGIATENKDRAEPRRAASTRGSAATFARIR